MGRQSRLVLLLLLAVGVFQVTHSSVPKPSFRNRLHDDLSENELDSWENYIDDPIVDIQKSGIKISTPKVKNVTLDTSTTTTPTTTTAAEAAAAAVAAKNAKPKTESSLPSSSKATTTIRTTTTTTQRPVSDEILNDLLEASKHNVLLAEDPRFNKMLPERLKVQNMTSSKNSSEELDDDYSDDDYYDTDYEYYNEDTTTTTAASAKPKKMKNSTPTPKLQPVKGDAKTKTKNEKSIGNGKTNDIDEDDERNYSDEEDYDEDDDEEDDIGEVVFSENVPCPRYCVCARNINSYLVATCSRLDPGLQKFGSDITDIIVTDVGPKYPILLGPKFFIQLGLKNVASIKIANCTIEYMHPEAFHFLDDLYAVNLTNVGLAIISPDIFAQNKKLRMLTISGNDLSVMSSVHYLLKSSSLEELDLSRNNLMELNPNAFSQLSNIVYINLSHNNLQKIPEKVFDTVETIEELDLSYNTLKELPAGIFNHTALDILNLKFNSISKNFHFGTSDLQQLDLSFNMIKQVHHGMFDKMVGLTNLNLRGNGMNKIQPDSFLNQKNLRHIDLSLNELDQISHMLFFKNSDLDVIRLNDNARLSQLPTDGFLSYNGYFTVFYLDLSNCAIGALGHKTFSTMPHLTTLKLAWNNINNLKYDTFASLTKLIDLDLNNNLISRLDDLLFMENNELTKLNLAGNPIRKLSTRVFMPLVKLRELDVSDCDLTSLLSETKEGLGYKFYNSLRSFNASSNQIRQISSADVMNFKNLHSLDITHNPLKCNEAFQDFISYASLHTHMLPKKMPALANLEEAATFVEIETQAGWSQLAHEVCKHSDEIGKDDKLEKRLEEAGKELDEDSKDLLNILSKSKLNKMQKILKDSQKQEPTKDDALEAEPLDEEDLNNGGEDTDEDDDDYDEDEDDDDDEENNDNENNENADARKTLDVFEKTKEELANKIKDYGIKVEEVNLSKETKDNFLLHKLGENDGDDEEIIIERGRIYYTGYNFMIPIVIVVTCLVVILLAIAKLVTMVLRKRGERYRMALLASKNSIVYQKLTEDIVKPTQKEGKLPKVHKYAPINQV